MRKLRAPGTDDRYLMNHLAAAYARHRIQDSFPPPWAVTERAKFQLLERMRLTRSRDALLADLLALDEEIAVGLGAVRWEYDRTGSAAPGNPARRQRDWVAAQQTNPRSVYSCYTD